MTHPGPVAVLHAPPGSAAVAAGSAGAAWAAVELLAAGGSAVDAALAAAFATAVTEPVLSSLGGGGFLLHAPAHGDAALLDFFVAVPGVGGADVVPHVESVVVDFARGGPAASASTQVFHAGWGTVAVPGCLSGYLDAQARWGALPLADVVAPAIRLARDGVDLTPVARRFVAITADLLLLTEGSRSLFAEAERSGRYANPAYADLLEALASGAVAGQHDPAYAGALLAASRDNGGLLTAADLAEYEPVLRRPLETVRSGARVLTNPPPSAGGAIVLDALGRLGATSRSIDWASVAAAQADAVAAHRGRGQVPTGTTHISVMAADGTTAALTTSNGSGSGTVVPGWGVPLNNMLGEEDLQPGEPLPPGARMGSMMAPTLVERADGSRAVLGTGGSERIRSAILGVVALLADAGADLADAVSAPRVHVGGDGQIHVEPGLGQDDLDALDRLSQERGWPGVDHWPTTNVYFGGVHAVQRTADGALTAVGDARRGGAVAIVRPDGSTELADSDR